MIPGFGEALAQKYQNMTTMANSDARLRDAQAQGILGALPSENELRQSQAYSARQQGATLMPLAKSSIERNQSLMGVDQTQMGLNRAQMGVAGAQQNYLGAEAQHIGLEGSTAAAPTLWQLYNGLSNTGYGLGSTTLQSPPPLDSGGLNSAAGAHLGSPGVSTISPQTTPTAPGGISPVSSMSVTDPADAAWRRPSMTMGYAAGTPNVTPQQGAGKMKAQARGGPQMARGAPSPAGGGHPLAGIIAQALQALHAGGGASQQPGPMMAAGGTPFVQGPPSPGQTVTSGSWGPAPTQPSPPPAQGPVFYPVPAGTPAGPPTFGKRVSAAGGATTVSPAGGGNVPPTAPPAQYPAPASGPGFGTRRPLTGTINASKGMSKVPGKGPPNKDSVPAVLAPQEAVLNAGAADHLGRGTIAMLNALGAAKMAAQGQPPQMPPSANGRPAQMPGRGMPPARKPQGKPQGKPVTKSNQPPIAAKAGGK